jgi:GT2 family glycosyltransferase
MNNIGNLTIVIVTYRTNEKMLTDCLNSIDSQTNILIVENSKNNAFKKKLENKYPNLNVILSGRNLGYGAGNNFGLARVKTKFALILNPDVILEENFFKEINNYLDQKINFHIIGVTYQDDTQWKTSGLFSEFDKRIKLKNETKLNHDLLKEVDWVVGCAMLINLENFDTKKIFDENFFLYFEEFDLCRRVRSNQGKIYSANNLLVKHFGTKGSAATDSDYSLESVVFKDWHFMWSTFYYYKKYYGYFYAVYKTYGKLFRSIFNMVLFTILFNKKKRTVYYARTFGIINAMLGKKSWYRVKSLLNDQES